MAASAAGSAGFISLLFSAENELGFVHELREHIPYGYCKRYKD